MCPKKRPFRRDSQKPRPPGRAPSGGAPAGRHSTDVRARYVEREKAWELVHPRCALERADDMEEVDQMHSMGETDVAIDELRWLLGGCPDFIDGHAKLGELAISENDLHLARAHFGNAFRIGSQALRRAGGKGPLPYRLSANQSFHSAGKGLVWCLLQLGKREMAREAAAELLALDPSDPLGVRALLEAPPPDSDKRRTPPADETSGP